MTELGWVLKMLSCARLNSVPNKAKFLNLFFNLWVKKKIQKLTELNIISPPRVYKQLTKAVCWIPVRLLLTCIGWRKKNVYLHLLIFPTVIREEFLKCCWCLFYRDCFPLLSSLPFYSFNGIFTHLCW